MIFRFFEACIKHKKLIKRLFDFKQMFNFAAVFQFGSNGI